MTWPMHDAGPTTPEPGSREPGYEPEPGPDEPGPGRHGRHAGDADPLPPLDGPMPGGGPSPAETTLPLALEWPAPPPRALRTPRFTPTAPPGSVDAPPGWRRVPRTTEYRPLPEAPPQPGYRPLPGAPPGGPPRILRVQTADREQPGAGSDAASGPSRPFGPGSVSIRLYPHNELPADAIVREVCAQARLASENGFDGVMTSEHHGGFAGYMAQPLQMVSFVLAEHATVRANVATGLEAQVGQDGRGVS